MRCRVRLNICTDRAEPRLVVAREHRVPIGRVAIEHGEKRVPEHIVVRLPARFALGHSGSACAERTRELLAVDPLLSRKTGDVLEVPAQEFIELHRAQRAVEVEQYRAI